jgi:hypothetical protein
MLPAHAWRSNSVDVCWKSKPISAGSMWSWKHAGGGHYVRSDMREVLRVLKPGGTLLIIAETYRSGKNNKLQGTATKLLGSTNLVVEDQQKLFANAGYTEIEVCVESRKDWICAMGRKDQP